jgi:ABC-type Zn uptake system ZnuABC Zn-binding protein ZnuA
MRTWKPLSVGALVAALAVTLAACSSGSSSSSTNTTVNPAQAQAQITTTYTNFFNGGSTDNAAKLALLQNNGKYKAVFYKNYANPAAATTAAKVDSVQVLSASDCKAASVPSPCAKVSYDLVSRQNGSPLLAGQTGYAVYQNGKWLISENTFCALISLAGSQCPT